MYLSFITFKKNSFLALAFLSFSQVFTVSATIVNARQARNYLEHVYATLFLPTNHAGNYERELKRFIDTATDNLLSAYGIYTSSYSLTKEYSTDSLYKAALKEAKRFIKRKSRQYAQEELRDFTVTFPINEQELIISVARKVTREVKTVIARSVTLDMGTFTNYCGTPLRSKLRELLKAELKRLQPAKPQLYATQECPICLEDFSARIQRLFLSCGHNLCVSCLKSYYYTQGKKITCPLCRAAINIQEFAHIFSNPAPSAPPFGV